MSIFAKTETDSLQPTHPTNGERPADPQGLESRNQTPDSTFLVDIEAGDKESIGLQVTIEINEWLDHLVKTGRRKHGKKIPKQVWIQAAIELLRSMPQDWTEVSDLEALRDRLRDLSDRLSKG